MFVDQGYKTVTLESQIIRLIFFFHNCEDLLIVLGKSLIQLFSHETPCKITLQISLHLILKFFHSFPGLELPWFSFDLYSNSIICYSLSSLLSPYHSPSCDTICLFMYLYNLSSHCPENVPELICHLRILEGFYLLTHA